MLVLMLMSTRHNATRRVALIRKRFHFEQLASDNEAVEYQIVNVARLQSEIAVPLLA